MTGPSHLRRVADYLSTPSNGVTLVALLACSVPIIAFATAELSPRAHTALSAILIAVALVVATGWSNVRLVVALLSIAVSARYIWYRATHTLLVDASVDGAAALALFLAEVYAFVVLVCGYFQTAIVRRRAPAPLHLSDDELPAVDVFVPSYNEDTDLLRDTLVGCMSMDWPNKRVYLLDDGRRPEARALAAELGCEYLTRADNRGAKAGNVNAALKRTDSPYIAFFDADHVPVRSFLRSTMGFLVADPKVALVQTPHYFYNPDQFERNLHTEGAVPSEQKLFYHAIQPGNDFWNSSFFCGSCAVIRREAMVGVGGMAEETLTEDAHTALKMHAAGWQSVYLDMPLAAGIATERLSFYISQRIRWARGMAQVFRLDNPLLKRGLSLAQRLNYFAASWHFLFGLPRMVFVIAPILYLVFGLHPVFADVREVLVFAIPHLLLAWIGQTVVNGNFRHSFWPEVFETVMAPYAALVTTLALIAPRGGSFKVTTKGATNDRAWFDWRHALPALVLLAGTVAGIIGMFVRLYTTPLDQGTILVAGAWNLYNLGILAAAVATAVERPQRRTRHRVRRRWRAVATYVSPDAGVPLEWLGETMDLSPGGTRVRFPGQPRLSDQIELRLEASWGLTSWMSARVLEQKHEGTDTVARLQFEDLTQPQRNDLVLFLFSDSASWLEDRFMPDSPGRSILAVFVTPLAVLFGRGGLIRAAVGSRSTELIVAPRLVPTCRACGEPLDPRETICSACSEPVPQPTRVRRGPLPSPRVLGLSGAILLLALALGAIRGESIEVFDQAIPLDRWTGFTYSSRRDQLGRAWNDLAALRDELAEHAAEHAPLPSTWRTKSTRVRRIYQLGAARLADPQGRAAEGALDAAALLLHEAGEAFGPDGRSPLFARRLESATTALSQAAQALGLPES